MDFFSMVGLYVIGDVRFIMNGYVCVWHKRLKTQKGKGKH